MTYFEPHNPKFPEMNPVRGILSFLMVFVISYAIGSAIGSLALLFAGGLSLEGMGNINHIADLPHGKQALLAMQGISMLLGFGGSVWIFLRFIEKSDFSLYLGALPGQRVILLSLLVSFFLIILNSVVIDWNANIEIGGSFGEWARKMEDQNAYLTEKLTEIDHFGQFIFAFIVIALIPAFCEEFVFRGVLQTKFWQLFKNPHIAIWLSAFIFSAIHFQFFGFLPRVVLGALFGYLFYFSGNLWLAIIAHLFNNTLTLIMVYGLQLSGDKIAMEEVEKPEWWIILLAAAAFFFSFRVLFMLLNKRTHE